MMKILYILATAYIIYMVKRTEPFKSSYDLADDSFSHYRFAVAPCMVLAVVTNFFDGFNLMQVKLVQLTYCSTTIGRILANWRTRRVFLACIICYAAILGILDISGGNSHRSSARCVDEVPRSRESYR